MSDEERARTVAENLGEFHWPLNGPYKSAEIILSGAFASVRAEEREACCDELWRVCALIGAKPGSSIHSAFKHAYDVIRGKQ
jgi:hypothetical protein